VTAIQTLAFGDLDQGVWGAAWLPDAASGPLAARIGSEAAALAATVDRDDEEDQWRIEGDQISLLLSRSGPAAHSRGTDGELDAVDQLCRVTGKLTLEARDYDISCLGWRSSATSTVELDRIESFRIVSAWFDAEDGIALTALRPRKSRGQESDIVAAAALDPSPAPAVTDPRLSTTYTGAGLPARAGLELWFEEDPAAESGPDGAAPPYPRRAAGEAIGAGLDWQLSGFDLHAEPLRWHSRGRDGAGVYLLGRRR
jgi:hypothetical protein